MMSEEGAKDEGNTVDLHQDDSLKVSIADALNEQDIVKFTVHTKTTLERFKKREFQVTRQHEEFVWLHDRFTENDEYAGLLIPPCPPKPDFSQSHGKLAMLQAGDATLTPEEIEKLKQEIQSEYLAAFQKTVAMHEVFLMRLVSHKVFRDDDNLQAFLEYEQDLQVRSKSRREKVTGFFKQATKTIDSSFATYKDPDEFLDEQRSFITRYSNMIKDARTKCEVKVDKRHQLVNAYGRAGTELSHSGNMYPADNPTGDLLRDVGATMMKAQAIEKKLVAKEDLKLTDLLRYYQADGQAARDLMYRRVKALQEQERTEKALQKAQAAQKKVPEAEAAAKIAKERAEALTVSAKEELKVFKERRMKAFRKGIVQYTQCQIRQGREQFYLWKGLLTKLKEDS
jgi:sorting nexin-5/6/32